MLALVEIVLGFVPDKPESVHKITVVTVYLHVKFGIAGQRSV